MKRLKFGLFPALFLLLASCSNDSQAMVKVNLAPVPYSIEVPAEIAKHLSVENMVTSTPNEFTNQAREAGAIAQVYINYKADDGTMHGFAGVYYFNKADFEKAGNPNEPPVYGSKVLEEKSMVLSIAEVWHFLRVMGERFLPFFFFGFRERLFHLFCLFFCDRGGKKETHLISFLPSPRPPALFGKKNGPGVPINELHAQGYVSIGCEPCTKAVLPNQHEREGRWWWEDAKAKECGLHSGNVVQSAAEQAEKETARDLWADASSAVERLTRAQLEKASGSSKGDDDKATLVALYAPWCQYSQAMEQAYEELAARYANHPRVRVAAFRADEAEHRPFAESALGLETFPTVVMLPRGSKKAVKYDSEARDVESLEMFLRALGTTSE